MTHHILDLLAGAILGAFSNLYRGGIFGHRKDAWIDSVRPVWLSRLLRRVLDGKIVNAFIYAAFVTVVYASEYTGMVDGIPRYSFHSIAPALFAYSAIVMLRFSAPRWGEYIGAAGGWRPTLEKPLEEGVEYIDRLIDGFRHRPRLWGVAGLSIRCGEWGLFLGAPLVALNGFYAFMPLLAGLLAGPLVYVLSHIPVVRDRTWQWFEAILGGLYFTAVLAG